MNPGDRVRHKGHPELGFGTVKAVEEDPLEETELIHVAFDWSQGTTTCRRGDLSPVPTLGRTGRVSPDELGNPGDLRRLLGCAMILSENARTASFARSFITPLPHQAYLLEKIHSQNRLGHLVADDVGMGKTIEAGLIISAARQANPKLRVLILAPKNVVLQWQDEMEEHFGLDFRIAKRDFEIRNPKQWGGINLVVASRDGMKQERYREVLRAIPPFDFVIVDEAHALTVRRDFLSGDVERTQNFRFVKWMSEQHVVSWTSNAQGAPRSPNFIFLTATPHQGDDTRFAHLLSLLRPDLLDPDSGDWLERQSEVLGQCVSRTPKKRAVDWNGNPIFKGHTIKTIDVGLSDKERHCLAMLGWFVRERMVFHASGKAESLVRALAMHTYQKIAASSWAALAASLKNRLEGRREDPDESELAFDFTGSEQEIRAIEDVLAIVGSLGRDSKFDRFMDLVRPGNGFREDGEKVLVFTQFRMTQSFLKSKLEHEGYRVATINGLMSVDERRAQRAFFEDEADFMISTEAGSEGANLQRKCHLLVNYDSPWNPMRLLQRIGRLDRYGQTKPVKAITLRAPESWDARIASKIEVKLASIQDAMGHVAEEDYHDMIVGQIYGNIDVVSIMSEAEWDVDSPKVDQAIEKEIERIRRDANRLKRILSESVGMPEGFEKRQSALDGEDFRTAFKWAAAKHRIRLRETRTQDNKFLRGVYHFTLPPSFRGLLRAGKECYLVFDRDRFAEVRGEVIGRARGQEIKPSLAGMGDPVTDWFFKSAISADLDSVCYALAAPQGSGLSGRYWVVFLAAWSNPQAGPDFIDVCEIDGSGAFLRRPSPEEVFACLRTADSPLLEADVAIPDLETAIAEARSELKKEVLRSPGIDRNKLRFVPWLLVAWR